MLGRHAGQTLAVACSFMLAECLTRCRRRITRVMAARSELTALGGSVG